MTYEKIGLIGFGSWVKEAYLPFINNLDTGRVTHISTRSQNSLNNAKLSFGDDAKYIQRDGKTSPPFPNHNMTDGQKLREDWFPYI